ncbi:MAG TPA: hypothetical protein VFE50_25930 [Cyclobacteriaceae bacterium]|nr:hypothetical protein [Cyclobacteriaceae bacterium]
MHSNRIVLFCLFISICGIASGQDAPSSLNPGKQKETNSMLVTTSKKAKHKRHFFSPSRKQNVKHTARYEFYERIEQAAKDKQRLLKKLSKPQYSDPRYFGHKRIPKRRPANKMRYCGECGIRH